MGGADQASGEHKRESVALFVEEWIQEINLLFMVKMLKRDNVIHAINLYSSPPIQFSNFGSHSQDERCEPI